MAINHIPRLLRLARRTGDRLIVTDEAGGGEPMVILPLEEYEALIDQAFGPGQGAFSDEGIDLPVYGDGRARSGVPMSGVDEETEAMIELSEEVAAEVADETADEADIDEEALKSLWQAPEEAPKTQGQEKNVEKPQEVVKKKSSRGDGGEEEFYLEQID